MLFSFAGDGARDTLQGRIEMRDLLPMETIYRRLAGDGVRSVAFQPAAFSPSTYDSVALDGAELHAYPDVREGARMLAETLADPAGPTYAYLYWDGIDATGHKEGPGSPAFDAACVAALDALEAALFFGSAARPAPSTLLLLTADHGQFAVDPAQTDYLEDFYPELPGLLHPAVPAGSARDVFLHLRDGHAKEVARELGERLDGRAAVHVTADLVERGIFGKTVGPRLRERLGDVCVLPAPGPDGLAALGGRGGARLPRASRRPHGSRDRDLGRRDGPRLRRVEGPLDDGARRDRPRRHQGPGGGGRRRLRGPRRGAASDADQRRAEGRGGRHGRDARRGGGGGRRRDERPAGGGRLAPPARSTAWPAP